MRFVAIALVSALALSGCIKETAHARNTHHVVIQDLDVSPEIAERALQLVRATSPVTSAFCASASSAILRQIP